MNKSKIEWCDHTWNPITGCNHGCHYCYARTMTARFSGDVRLNKMCKADYSTQTGPDGSTLYVLDKPMLSETGHPLVYPFGFEPTFHRYRMDTIGKLKLPVITDEKIRNEAIINYSVAVLAEVAERAKQEDAPIYEGDKEVDQWVRLSDVEEAINKYLN